MSSSSSSRHFYLPFIFPSMACFIRQFLRKMWVIQLAFLLFIVLGYSSPPCLYHVCMYVILLHYSHERSNISSPSFPSTTFQNFPGTSDLLSEVSKLQHHTKLCTKYSTALVSSFKTFGGEKSLLVECCLCHGNPLFNFTCTPFVICYHTTQVVEIFHILQLFFIYHNLYWGWLSRVSYYPFFAFISVP
jgi:hypothetical protein